ncbi:hypothetical protein FQN52_004694 [Onygenales sp. PD_12]|nr:hypothetical protein FQN52_004694 [Onygenales sp. PD_12]KAK2790848.1 hypothetical protein FQN53_008672 [Emmonsiellopsis sp. PD_33]
MSYNIVFLTGPPGSGKSSLGRELARNYKIYYLSIEEFLGAAVDGGNTQPLVEFCYCRGIVLMLREKIKQERNNGHKHFLIDGFPLSFSQAFAFEKMLRMPMLVVVLKCPKEIAMKRFLDRGLPDQPIPASERFEILSNRFAEQETDLLQYYGAAGTLEKIDSSVDVERIYAAAATALEKNANWGGLRQAVAPVSVDIDTDMPDVIIL